MVRILGYQRKCPGRHEDDQEKFSGRPQPFSGRRGHVDTQTFLAWLLGLRHRASCGLLGLVYVFQVSAEGPHLGEGLAAQAALIGPLAGVGSQVQLQVLAPFAGLAADGAGEAALEEGVRVGPHLPTR